MTVARGPEALTGTTSDATSTMPPSATDASRALRDAARGALALRVPVRWLEEHAVLPLREEAGVVVVAADGEPSGLVADALRRTLGAPLRFTPAAASEIRAALVSAPRAAVTTASEARGFDGEETASLDDLRALASREPVVQVVNAVLAEAVRAGASDVHVESVADGLRVRLRLDGVLRDTQTLGKPFQAAVLSRLKVLAGLDIAERRLPQDGRARIRAGDREVDVRVSTLPALHGESMVLRLLDGAGGPSSRALVDLGIARETHGRLTAMLARSSGLVIVTGPTGSGKTTTLYAALAERSTPGVKTVTVEDPVEYRLDGIVQLPVNPKAGFGFASALRAILRHDPDVILVGEMRDAETAEIAVQAALTGHLVLSTLHTTDATSALARLTEMGVPPYLLAATLHGVLAQRLVRTVCDACGEWRALTESEQALLGASREAAAVLPQRTREGAGCAGCSGTGFRGRAAIAELLPLDEAVRSAFVGGASLDALRTLARSRGVRSLREDGWRLVTDGRTTIAEVVRVVSDDESSA